MDNQHESRPIAPDPWGPVDPLGEALHLMRMSGVFYTLSEFTAPWGIALPSMKNCLMFHVITAGRCWLEVEGAEPHLLQPGDLALVPHGEGHRLVSEPGVNADDLFDLPREQLSERYEILRHGAGGDVTKMVCGAVRFDHPASEHLVSLLPRMICIDAWNSAHAEWLQSTLRLMAAEAKDLRPGGETVITRLADILVIQAIRSWMAEDPAAQTGWLGALRDPQIGPTILLVHRDPSRLWTVESLAVEVGMSRSAFAARFKELEELTTSELAARTGLSKRKVKRQLTHRHFLKASVEELQKYADVFNIPVANFFQIVSTKQDGTWNMGYNEEVAKKMTLTISQEFTENPLLVITNPEKNKP